MALEKKEKILIIESDQAFGDLIAEVLTKKGYKVNLSRTAPEGLQAIFDLLPHLVILDVTLSGGDGYAILEKKQSESMLVKIPVFLLSNQVNPINMTRVPKDSVKEFLIAIHMNPADIATKVDELFGYTTDPSLQAPQMKGDKKKLLWVEDDRLIGTILSKKLLSSGFDLFHAKNGEEALEAMNQIVPDAIIIDLVLPNMSGFDILQAARRNSKLAKVPAMILSNLSKQSDIEKAKALGAQKFLVKAAVSLDQIIEEIRAMTK